MTQTATATTEPLVGWAWKCHKPRSWRLDFDAVREVVREHGITWPVVIGISEASRTAGTHRVKQMQHRGQVVPVHQITLRRTGTPESVSRTLHHELQHAVQAEAYRTEAAFSASYNLETARVGYRRNRFEVEARQAEELHDVYPLAVAR